MFVTAPSPPGVSNEKEYQCSQPLGEETLQLKADKTEPLHILLSKLFLGPAYKWDSVVNGGLGENVFSREDLTLYPDAVRLCGWNR